MESNLRMDGPPDGYEWRKYGHKILATDCSCARTYFWCAEKKGSQRCGMKKTVDRNTDTAEVIKISYDGGDHTHPPPKMQCWAQFLDNWKKNVCGKKAVQQGDCTKKKSCLEGVNSFSRNSSMSDSPSALPPSASRSFSSLTGAGSGISINPPRSSYSFTDSKDAIRGPEATDSSSIESHLSAQLAASGLAPVDPFFVISPDHHSYVMDQTTPASNENPRARNFNAWCVNGDAAPPAFRPYDNSGGILMMKEDRPDVKVVSAGASAGWYTPGAVPLAAQSRTLHRTASIPTSVWLQTLAGLTDCADVRQLASPAVQEKKENFHADEFADSFSDAYIQASLEHFSASSTAMQKKPVAVRYFHPERKSAALNSSHYAIVSNAMNHSPATPSLDSSRGVKRQVSFTEDTDAASRNLPKLKRPCHLATSSTPPLASSCAFVHPSDKNLNECAASEQSNRANSKRLFASIRSPDSSADTLPDRSASNCSIDEDSFRVMKRSRIETSPTTRREPQSASPTNADSSVRSIDLLVSPEVEKVQRTIREAIALVKATNGLRTCEQTDALLKLLAGAISKQLTEASDGSWEIAPAAERRQVGHARGGDGPSFELVQLLNDVITHPGKSSNHSYSKAPALAPAGNGVDVGSLNLASLFNRPGPLSPDIRISPASLPPEQQQPPMNVPSRQQLASASSSSYSEALEDVVRPFFSSSLYGVSAASGGGSNDHSPVSAAATIGSSSSPRGADPSLLAPPDPDYLPWVTAESDSLISGGCSETHLYQQLSLLSDSMDLFSFADFE